MRAARQEWQKKCSERWAMAEKMTRISQNDTFVDNSLLHITERFAATFYSQTDSRYNKRRHL